jgi:hypothetical protein
MSWFRQFTASFHKVSAVSSIASGLTTFAIHLVPLAWSNVTTLEQQVGLRSHPLYLSRLWMVYLHLLLVVIAMVGVALRKIRVAPGPAILGLIGYVFFAFAESSRVSLALFRSECQLALDLRFDCRRGDPRVNAHPAACLAGHQRRALRTFLTRFRRGKLLLCPGHLEELGNRASRQRRASDLGANWSLWNRAGVRGAILVAAAARVVELHLSAGGALSHRRVAVADASRVGFAVGRLGPSLQSKFDFLVTGDERSRTWKTNSSWRPVSQ